VGWPNPLPSASSGHRRQRLVGVPVLGAGHMATGRTRRAGFVTLAAAAVPSDEVSVRDYHRGVPTLRHTLVCGTLRSINQAVGCFWGSPPLASACSAEPISPAEAGERPEPVGDPAVGALLSRPWGGGDAPEGQRGWGHQPRVPTLKHTPSSESTLRHATCTSPM